MDQIDAERGDSQVMTERHLGVAPPRMLVEGQRLDRPTFHALLWLDPAALLVSDIHRLQAIVDLGCATPEHAEFVKKLAAARSAP